MRAAFRQGVKLDEYGRNAHVMDSGRGRLPLVTSGCTYSAPVRRWIFN
jgi:hypothetical protein